MTAETIITIYGLLKDRKELLKDMEREARKVYEDERRRIYEDRSLDDEAAENECLKLESYKAWESLFNERQDVSDSFSDLIRHDFH